jgi:hypothetical protein
LKQGAGGFSVILVQEFNQSVFARHLSLKAKTIPDGVFACHLQRGVQGNGRRIGYMNPNQERGGHKKQPKEGEHLQNVNLRFLVVPHGINPNKAVQEQTSPKRD